MTCNPHWQEIVESLGVKPNGTPVDAATRPDLLARVFYLKLKKLIADIKGTKSKPGCFGKVKNYVYTVEYQKRGMFMRVFAFHMWSFEVCRMCTCSSP